MTGQDAAPRPEALAALDLERGYVLIPVSVAFLPIFVDRWVACRRVRLSARSDGIYDIELEDIGA